MDYRSDSLGVFHSFLRNDGFHFNESSSSKNILCLEESNPSIESIINLKDQYYSDNPQCRLTRQLLFLIYDINDKEGEQRSNELVKAIRDNNEHTDWEIHLILRVDSSDDKVKIPSLNDSIIQLNSKSLRVYTWLFDKYDYNGRIISNATLVEKIMKHIDFLCNKEVNMTGREVLAFSREAYESGSLMQEDSPSQIKAYFNTFGNAELETGKEPFIKALKANIIYRTGLHLLNITDSYFESICEELKKKDEIDLHTIKEYLGKPLHLIPENEVSSLSQGFLLENQDDDSSFPSINLSDIHNNTNVIKHLSDTEEDFSIPYDNLISKEDSKLHIVDYWIKLEQDSRNPSSSISNSCVSELTDALLYHTRLNFGKYENRILKNRDIVISNYKNALSAAVDDILDGRLAASQYSYLHINLTEEETNSHYCLIDKALAFLDYLGSNKSTLIEKGVAVGDISLNQISQTLIEQKKRAEAQVIEEEKSWKEAVENIGEELKRTDDELENSRSELAHWKYELSNWLHPKGAGIFKRFTVRAKTLAYSLRDVFLIALAVLIIYQINILKPLHLWLMGITLVALSLAYHISSYLKVLKKKRALSNKIKQLIESKRLTFIKLIRLANQKLKARAEYTKSLVAVSLLKDFQDRIKDCRSNLDTFKSVVFRQSFDSYQVFTSISKDTQDDKIYLLNPQLISDVLYSKDIAYCFSANQDYSLSRTFNHFQHFKEYFSTEKLLLRPDLDEIPPRDEVIAPLSKHKRYNYKAISNSILFKESSTKLADTISIEDIKQGECGDCYFLATLAAIAHKQPEAIVNIIKQKDEHYGVYFTNADGSELNSVIDNKFWLFEDDTPIYARISKVWEDESSQAEFKEVWPMVVEKAWAKVNGKSYESIVGSNNPKYEYSYALTGKKAMYIPLDREMETGQITKLLTEHFINNKLPVTLYSRSQKDSRTDPNLVHYHAYALKNIDANGEVEIFNPWNNDKPEGVGKHFTNKDVQFILDNFETLILFDIEQSLKQSTSIHRILNDAQLFIKRHYVDDSSSDNYEQTINRFISNVEWFATIDRLSISDIFENKLGFKDLPKISEALNLLDLDSSVLFRKNMLYNHFDSDMRELAYSWHSDYSNLHNQLSIKDIDIKHTSSKNQDRFVLYRLLVAIKDSDLG